MRLARAAIAHQQHVLVVIDEFSRGQPPHQRFIHRWLGGKIKTIQGFEDRESGVLDPPLGGPLLSVSDFQFGQPQQVVGIIHVLFGAVLGLRAILFEHGRQFQLLEMMFQQNTRGVVAHNTPPVSNWR